MAQGAICYCEKNRDTIIKQIQSVSANMSWASKNMDELRKKHVHKYIAIHKKKIIGIGDTQREIIDFIKKKHPKEIGLISIEFIMDKDELWIL